MVRIIGLCHLDPANPIPKNIKKIGTPAVHYKIGMKNEPVQLENISATGIGLRFTKEASLGRWIRQA